LMRAASKNSYEVAKLLIEKGAKMYNIRFLPSKWNGFKGPFMGCKGTISILKNQIEFEIKRIPTITEQIKICLIVFFGMVFINLLQFLIIPNDLFTNFDFLTGFFGKSIMRLCCAPLIGFVIGLHIGVREKRGIHYENIKFIRFNEKDNLVALIFTENNKEIPLIFYTKNKEIFDVISSKLRESIPEQSRCKSFCYLIRHSINTIIIIVLLP